MRKQTQGSSHVPRAPAQESEKHLSYWPSHIRAVKEGSSLYFLHTELLPPPCALPPLSTFAFAI